MDPASSWTQSIDQYCERTDPTFWSEPLNAASNLAFIIAAWCLWRRYRLHHATQKARAWDMEVLIALIALVGIGSFVFHTFGTKWAQAADVIPIVIALIWTLAVFLKRQMDSASSIALGFGLFFAATAAFSYVPAEWSNNSQFYFSTAVTLFVMAKLTQHHARRYVLAGVVFLISLTCRALDLVVCDGLPLGTHFMWHTLNGLTFYLAVSALLD